MYHTFPWTDSICVLRTPFHFVLLSHWSQVYSTSPWRDSIYYIDSLYGDVLYTCDQCDNKTKWKGVLKTHIESVQGNVWYTCNQCDYKAAWKGILKRHLDSIHNLGRWIKRFHVTSVQSRFYKIAISKFIKETKMVRNLFHVISVQSHLHKICILKVIE